MTYWCNSVKYMIKSNKKKRKKANNKTEKHSKSSQKIQIASDIYISSLGVEWVIPTLQIMDITINSTMVDL